MRKLLVVGILALLLLASCQGEAPQEQASPQEPETGTQPAQDSKQQDTKNETAEDLENSDDVFSQIDEALTALE